MEILKDGGKQEPTPNTTTNTNPTTPAQGCLMVGARVIAGVICFVSALTFLGCVIGAAILPITNAGMNMSISGVEIVEGPIYIATFTCIICALAALIVTYITFCLAFSRRARGWIVALLLLLFVGGAVGGSVYGVKLGFNLYSIIDEIEQLDNVLDTIDDDDEEATLRAIFAGQGERTYNSTLEDEDDLAIIRALDVDAATLDTVREWVVLRDAEVDIRVEQAIDINGNGVRKISIKLPTEDINIVQSLPIAKVPALE